MNRVMRTLIPFRGRFLVRGGFVTFVSLLPGRTSLDADLHRTPVDATHYRGIIGSLMYLTSSRPDLIYAVCLCARYQAKPTEKHLNAVKRIFRYLKGTINMGLWYSKDTGKEYPFDLSKPLPLIMERGRQVVPVDYFINNDLKYPRGGCSIKKYTTSTTKTKAAKYDIPGIEDMVPSLWSPVKEGDFLRLHLHDIKDMLLLLVQKKLSNLDRDVIFDLGVKKLNITKPETFRSDISNRIPYTAYNNPQGIIYVDKYKRNRLMCSDELYKFSDGTLTSVRTVLHDIASNLRMDYLPKRK
ncbi:hypothetical protein Tco_1531707 [Tanacetum coccineum]